VRVGFITQLLWHRYGPFWKKLLEDAGVEAVLPNPILVRRLLDEPRLLSIPSIAFRLATSQALVLSDVDLLIAPDLSEGEEVNRGAGQDPWVAQFSETLQGTVGGLPRTISVPARLKPAIEGRAIEVLHRVLQDPAKVRRVWERNRANARQSWFTKSAGCTIPGPKLIGFLGQPWLVVSPLLHLVKMGNEGILPQSSFNPEALRQEASGIDMKLVPTDREVLGAARVFMRRGDVGRIVVLTDRSSADAWLLRTIRRMSHKPVEALLLEDLPKGVMDSLLVSGAFG
jgi:hypothetical protein